MSAQRQVVAGFIPLLDAAVPIAAKECGFADAEGLDLKLVRETSWANIRDRMAVGHFDVAHMLAPMPIASTLKLTSLSVPMRAPMVLGLGGNAITVSGSVADAMIGFGWDRSLDPALAGAALNKVVAKRQSMGAAPLRFGVVHPFSGHAYELRYWLAASGIDPNRNIEITVLPPPFMPDALKTAQLDGYCVGEPWNTVAVAAGDGIMATCKQAIWPDSPEKVLGVTETWLQANSEPFAALIRALSEAADWCARPENTADLARIMAGPDYLNCVPDHCLPALTGNLQTGDGHTRAVPRFFRFVSKADALPRTDHALWFYSQMVRWGQAAFSEADSAAAASVFDDRSTRAVFGLAGERNDIEATPVPFFDGREFSGDALAANIDESGSKE